jgi:acyl-CoA thioester hydrolase
MDDRIERVVVHQKAIRIYYEDTDAGGIVYYANYLKFAERARTEMLRKLGIESSELMDDYGVALAVKRCNADYQKPAKLDDALIVETELKRVGGASLELQQIVKRDGEHLVCVDIKLGCLDLNRGKPRAIPEKVRARLNEYFEEAHKEKNEAEG